MDGPSLPPKETPLVKSAVFWIAIAIVLAFGVGLYYWEQRGVEPPATAPAPTAAAPEVATSAPQPEIGALTPASAVQPQVRYPVPAAASAPTAQAALPPLDESDKPIRESLSGALSKNLVDNLSLSPDVIRQLVATVDNLARPYAGGRLPLRPPPGALDTTQNQDIVYLSRANYDRYARYVRLAQALDAKKAADVYFRFYPLFQQAYEELGYPNRYFNDRLIEVTDHLLAAPEVPGPIELVPTGGMYQFADPDLEDLSAGRKLLLRMGPENAAVIKAKLRELRREVARESASVGGGG